MKVVVTGGFGFLGSSVCAAMQTQGVTAVPLGRAQGDLSDPAVAEHLLRDADVVVHLAADVGGVGYLRSCAGRSFHANYQLGLNVIRAAMRGQTKRLVLAGTPCAYSGDAELPLREESLLTGVPSGDTGNYGYAKLASSLFANSICPTKDIDTVTVIPSNLYGPGDNYDNQRGHVVAALLRKALEAAAAGAPTFSVWGDGSATRDFVYVHDVAAAIATVALSPQPGRGEMFNFGSGRETSIRELAETIAMAVHPRLKPVFESDKPVGYTRRVMSVAKANRVYGYMPKTELAPGIQETVDNLRESGIVEQWTKRNSKIAA